MIIFLSSAASQTSSSLFQCQKYRGGLFYTPNLPNSHFNPFGYENAYISNLAGADYGVTYIFTIPPEPPGTWHCNGGVLAIQICYQATGSDYGTVDFLRILTLVENNDQFNIIKSVIVQANSSASTCRAHHAVDNVEQICCEKIQFSSTDQFPINSSNFTFGLVILNANLRPLLFVEDYNVCQYQVMIGNTSARSILAPSKSQMKSHSLLLMRFFLGKSKCIYIY